MSKAELKEALEPDRAALIEKLARYMGGDCFDDRRRSSRNQHAANKAKSYYRKLAKRVLKFRPIAAALSSPDRAPAVGNMVSAFATGNVPQVSPSPEGGEIGRAEIEHIVREEVRVDYKGKLDPTTPASIADRILSASPSRKDGQAEEIERLVEFQALLTDLCAEEGDSITLCSDNADFGLPSNAVDCNGAWTGWEDRRFTGGSLIEAVRSAARARAALNGEKG